ncbi:MAG: hypothetical protein KDI30_01575, partial [Pseudomonadales bacterium]|nr:hypothetical protein [Pseudomonadales bacterium]
ADKCSRFGWPLLFAFLWSCVPNATVYFHPSVENGVVTTPHCVPAESIIDFQLGEGEHRLQVRALADNGDTVHQVALFFGGNHWRSIHFFDTGFVIRDLESHVIITPSSLLAYKVDSIEPLTVEPYLAPAGRPGLSRFSVQINTAEPLPDNFELQSPPAVVDGEQIAFPPIRFERKVWAGISPFNC